MKSITGMIFAAASIVGFNLTLGHVPAWALGMFATALVMATEIGWLQQWTGGSRLARRPQKVTLV